MAIPPPLNYYTPPQTASTERLRAASLARINGIAALILGMGCVLIVVPGNPHMPLAPPGDYFDRALFPPYLVYMPLAGIVYLTGGIIIRRPHRTWEFGLLVVALPHIGLLLLMLGRLVFVWCSQPNAANDLLLEIGGCIQFVLIVSLVCMASRLLKLREEV